MSLKSDTTMEMQESPEEKSLNPNDIEMKPEKEKGKSPMKYFLDLLSDSVVTSVPQIVTVSNLLRKVFKVLVLATCIGGFIYQTTEFMKLYNTYPLSLEIEVKYAKLLPAPTITICNRNPVKRTPFCKDNPGYCSAPKNLTRFCNMYPRFCDENTTLDDLKFVDSDIFLNNREYINKYRQEAEEFIDVCCFAVIPFSKECRNATGAAVYRTETQREQNCYIIKLSDVDMVAWLDNLNLLEEDVARCAFTVPVAVEQLYTFVINLDPKEYTRPDTEPAAQAVVHSWESFENPFMKGFTMEEGKRYTVLLKAFEKHLLPAPYSTNCTENSELDDYYSKQLCELKCIAELSFSQCDCVSKAVHLDIEVRTCDDNNAEQKTCVDNLDTKDCYESCPIPCHFSYFEHEVIVSDIENTIMPIDLGDGPVHKNDWNNATLEIMNIARHLTTKGKSFLTVAYTKKEVTVLTYKPKYERIEILGYIGGYSGIWLGISLVAIFDFLETLVVFSCFLCRRTKKKISYNVS